MFSKTLPQPKLPAIQQRSGAITMPADSSCFQRTFQNRNWPRSSRGAAPFVLAVGVSPRRSGKRTEPRSGGICVSRGRKPAVKWKKPEPRSGAIWLSRGREPRGEVEKQPSHRCKILVALAAEGPPDFQRTLAAPRPCGQAPSPGIVPGTSSLSHQRPRHESQTAFSRTKVTTASQNGTRPTLASMSLLLECFVTGADFTGAAKVRFRKLCNRARLQ
jgi:hypothetical protein